MNDFIIGITKLEKKTSGVSGKTLPNDSEHAVPVNRSQIKSQIIEGNIFERVLREKDKPIVTARTRVNDTILTAMDRQYNDVIS